MDLLLLQCYHLPISLTYSWVCNNINTTVPLVKQELITLPQICLFFRPIYFRHYIAHPSIYDFLLIITPLVFSKFSYIP